jgi:hypothetical protein
MKRENIKHRSDGHFRRIAGLKRSAFYKALEALNSMRATERADNAKGSGRKPKLSMEGKLLAALERLREYRAFARVAASFGAAESDAFRIIRRAENALAKGAAFRSPGEKAPLAPDMEREVICIGAAAPPAERPKKTAPISLGKEEKARDKGAGGCRRKRQANCLRAVF